MTKEEKLQEAFNEFYDSLRDTVADATNEEILASLDKRRLASVDDESSKEVVMDLLCDELVARGIYPATSGIKLCPRKMVEFYGTNWHQYSEPHYCSSCNYDLRDLENGPPFKKEIGIYDIDADMTIAFKCPNCKEGI